MARLTRRYFGRGFDSPASHIYQQSTISGEEQVISNSSAKGYADVALDYLERGFEPIPVKGKRPVPAGMTGRAGVVDEERVRALMADPEWAPQNVALRAGPLEVRIDVDDYGPKQGAAQLAELEARLGPLPATISSTARGKESGSRQHFFLLHEPVDLVGKAADDIDVIQHSHRYSMVWPSINPDAYDPATGYPQYVWYDADGEPMDRLPTLDDFEYLPEAWVQHLHHEQVEHGHQADQWDGDLPEEATETERRKIRAIISRLQGLPEVWAPGAGWHDTVFSAACWLSRISRSNAYHLTPDQALQVLIDHAPTYGREWPVERIIEQWESALKVTEGQYEEPPEEDRPPLLDSFTIIEAQGRLPMSFGRDGRDFLTDGIGGVPASDDPGAMWAHRSRVIKALLEAGFTPQETATLVWMAPSARPLNEDLDGVRKLWNEVDEAEAELAAAEEAGSGSNVAPAPIAERSALRPKQAVELLTLEERAWVEGDAQAEWFGSRFVEHYRSILPIMSEPYFRLNRWFILSGIFGNLGIIPRNGESDLGLNVYAVMLGPTTSGKSESMTPVYEVFAHFFQGSDDNPDIGGNATPEALHEKLIERDGKASWFHADEADKILRDWSRDVGPYSGMKQVVTFAFDGMVAAILRATKKDISGKSARVALSTHLTGVPEKVLAVIEPQDWESGFINRFVWVEGHKFPRDRKALRFNLRRPTDGGPAPRSKMTAYWAAQFQVAATRVRRPDGRPVEIDVTDEVIERHIGISETLLGLALSSKYAAQLEATFDRLRLTILKCAGLIALSEGRKVIEMRDLLIATHQAEEWATNILAMVERTQETPWVKHMNFIEACLVARPEGVMPKSELYRELQALQLRKRDADELLDNLVAQGRVEKKRRPDTGEEVVILKGVTT